MHSKLKGVLAVTAFMGLVSFAGLDAKSIVPLTSPIKQQEGQGTAPQTTTSRKPYTCQCEDASNPICANNGVTYRNMCRFECAKHKIERLRVVKEGDCGKYISKLQFWNFG